MNKDLQKLTSGLLVDYHTYEKLLLSPELPRIYSRDQLCLLIYAISSRLSRITIYPTTSHIVWKITLNFSRVDPQIISQLTKLLQQCQIMHTTGICEEGDTICVEYYVIPFENDNQAEIWLNKIRAIEIISGLKLDILKVD